MRGAGTGRRASPTSSEQLLCRVGIEWRAASVGARATDAPGGSAESGEARCGLPRGVHSPVVDGRHLDVFHVASSVRALVFDPDVGELDVFVDDREIVLDGPLPDFVAGSIRPTIAV